MSLKKQSKLHRKSETSEIYLRLEHIAACVGDDRSTRANLARNFEGTFPESGARTIKERRSSDDTPYSWPISTARANFGTVGRRPRLKLPSRTASKGREDASLMSQDVVRWWWWSLDSQWHPENVTEPHGFYSTRGIFSAMIPLIPPKSTE